MEETKNIQFQRLTEVNKTEIIALMNNHLVKRQMPLLKGGFDEGTCDKFIKAKEHLWNKYGYGPWAIIINDKFAGWGGLQPEHGEADLALVLHPNYWGLGKVLYNQIIAKAFGEMGLQSVTVLFPPSRTRIKGLLKLGFKKDDELMIGNEQFLRFRLMKSQFPEIK